MIVKIGNLLKPLTKIEVSMVITIIYRSDAMIYELTLGDLDLDYHKY